MENDLLELGDKKFTSRLIIGSGKFSSPEIMKNAIEASGASMVTVALRRIDLKNPSDHLLKVLDLSKITLLPNTSGAQTAEEAIRLAKLARATSGASWIKLEVTPDPRYLLPDGEETLKAAETLVKEGFNVMPYINADPLLAKKLEECGCVCVMPLGSPIGTNQGITNQVMLKIIIEESSVPVIIDAGIGVPSDAALAMEMGAQAVMINTAIAASENPVLMAESFKEAVISGRKAFLAGFPPTQDLASPSSTLDWISRIS